MTDASSAAPEPLQLDLPAAHSACRMARHMAREFAATCGLDEDRIQTLEFVVGELLDNAVDHGGGQAAMDEADLESDVRMKLELSASPGGWSVRVDDQGGGDPDRLRAGLADDAMPDLEDERGRGLTLLVHMVDRMEVERSRDGLGLAVIASSGDGATPASAPANDPPVSDPPISDPPISDPPASDPPAANG